MADWPEEGTLAPDFTLPSDDGTKVKLSKLRGAPVLLFFYPADDTPVCTREVCMFRDAEADWSGLGVKILGVSPDDVESHAKFRDKFDLNFTLLADVGHVVTEKYGAWREKNMYGKIVLGVVRSSFLIDEKGVIRKVWKRVLVDKHRAQVVEALKALKGE